MTAARRASSRRVEAFPAHTPRKRLVRKAVHAKRTPFHFRTRAIVWFSGIRICGPAFSGLLPAATRGAIAPAWEKLPQIPNICAATEAKRGPFCVKCGDKSLRELRLASAGPPSQAIATQCAPKADQTAGPRTSRRRFRTRTKPLRCRAPPPQPFELASRSVIYPKRLLAFLA